ncbi:hypothetical protein V5F40_06855 [Xanthobacter sp. DSM 14520]|uniref:hypothetical protein n=1 Tax=Xanthobacter autotrophicus (strain ATCC BAA-1158 / Py2) TaxID=78245 RepID=UPI00372C2DAA
MDLPDPSTLDTVIKLGLKACFIAVLAIALNALTIIAAGMWTATIGILAGL